MLLTATIRDLALDARRLDECPDVPQKLLERWCDRAAGGDSKAFAEYRIRRSFAKTGADGKIPSWVEIIEAICQQARVAAEPLNSPFEDILAPVVRVASERLARRAGDRLQLLSAAARLSLERTLLKRLSLHVAPVLALEFDAGRAPGVRMAMRWLPPEGQPSTASYTRFVDSLLEDGLAGFFRRHSALARAIATMVEFWIESSHEFLQRLDRDFAGIRVTSLNAGVSDPHHNGRTVILVSGENDRGLVYKPRDVRSEAAFARFIGWCNGNGAPFDLLAPGAIPRPGYGWLHRISVQPLKDEDAAQRYYRRAGALLAVLHLLGATDVHHENILAAGEYPVLVDAETLLTPVSEPANRVASSVMRTGMLPCTIGDARSGLAYDVSALGDCDGLLPEIPVWRDVNTDAMRQVRESAKLSTDHLPSLKGVPLRGRMHAPQIREGFTAMLHWLVSRKQTLLAEDGPLALFRDIVTRVVPRPTAVYGMLLHNSLKPEAVSSGLERSVELEYLARAPRHPAILDVEREALENLDVPWFCVRAGATTLETGAGRDLVPGYFRKSGFDELVDRVNNLSPELIGQELMFIDGAFAEPRQPALSVNPAPANLIDTAAEIARQIAKAAIRDHDGGASWCSLAPVGASGPMEIQPAGPFLYDGAAGTALFLATLDWVRGTQEYRDLILSAMKSATAAAATGDPALPVGAAIGLGSIIYTLVRIAALAGAPGLLGKARTIASLITPQKIDADDDFDVMTGSAGAILGLLTLHAVTGDSGSLASARAAGDHLIARSVLTTSGFRAWRAHSAEPLGGMSHGAAGISYALLRLFGATGDDRYRDAAAGAIAYENTLWCPSDSNWKDLRDSAPADGGGRMSWCHGAPGIGIARLGGLQWLDGPEVRANIEAAMAATREHCQGPVDHLCCGVFGRIETLLAGSVVLGSRQLHQECRTQARQSLERGLFVGHNVPALAPGLFRGIAGIGYQLLRIEYPGQIPSLLLWN